MKKIMFNDKYGLTQAVLEGRKTQTRRIIKTSDAFERVNPDFDWDDEDIENWENDFSLRVKNMYETEKKECFNYLLNHPKYKLGEVVAIAQSYHTIYDEFGLETMDMIVAKLKDSKGWSNKMYVKPKLMPHQIRITNVRIERLQDISDEDCLKEGIEFDGKAKQFYCGFNKSTNSKIWLGRTPREAYASLIDKVGKKGDWESNPYVFVYDFELVK